MPNIIMPLKIRKLDNKLIVDIIVKTDQYYLIIHQQHLPAINFFNGSLLNNATAKIRRHAINKIKQNNQ